MLSRRRTEAVKDYLVRRAFVAPARLQTVGKGPTKAVNLADPGAAENRRVIVNLATDFAGFH